MTHTKAVHQTLIEAGYSFTKIDQHAWQMREGEVIVAEGRSLGDIIREQAKALGVW